VGRPGAHGAKGVTLFEGPPPPPHTHTPTVPSAMPNAQPQGWQDPVQKSDSTVWQYLRYAALSSSSATVPSGPGVMPSTPHASPSLMPIGWRASSARQASSKDCGQTAGAGGAPNVEEAPEGGSVFVGGWVGGVWVWGAAWPTLASNPPGFAGPGRTSTHPPNPSCSTPPPAAAPRGRPGASPGGAPRRTGGAGSSGGTTPRPGRS
jgi:hypothetical protein